MSYLIFKEDLQTAVHNTINGTFVGGFHALNAKDWGIIPGILNPVSLPLELVRNIFRTKDNFDEKYFDSMYHISDPLKKKLQNWLSKIKGCVFTGEAMQHKHWANMSNLGGQNSFNTRNGVSTNLASKHTRLATRAIGHGNLTTATCFKIIPALSGKGHHILYFTFDGDSIEDVKTLCFVGGDPKSSSNYKVIKLSQWNSIPSSEYKK